jgi:tRNA dimethylallyltransferase
MNTKSAIIIAGPTAVGKTALSIQLARQFQTEIISADSRQCYRELHIGVAKPNRLELQSVKHHFIDSHSIQDQLTAASFEQYALQKAAEIFREQDKLIVTGGTGLYLKAFISGFDAMPPVSGETRDLVRAIYLSKGLIGLREQLEKEDPVFSGSDELKNPQRMMRALEFIRTTGTSIRNFQRSVLVERPFRTINIGLELPRAVLYERINARVDKMMEDGLLDEVKKLLPYKHLNASQTVGYRELFDYLDGNMSLEKAVDKIKQNTRHYAKRQLTWFKADTSIRWFDPGDIDSILTFINTNRLLEV